MMSKLSLQIKTLCQQELGEHENQRDRLKFQPMDETGDKVQKCLEGKLMEGKIAATSACGRVIENLYNDS